MNARLVHGWVTMAEVRRAVGRFSAAQKPLSNDTWYRKLTNLFIYYLMRSEIGVFMPVLATVVGTKIFKMACRSCLRLLFLLYKFISVQ